LSRYRRSTMAAALAAERARARALRFADQQQRHQRRLIQQSAQVAASEIARARTLELDERMAELSSLVSSSTATDYRISWSSLRAKPNIPAFAPGALMRKSPEPLESDFAPQAPTLLERLIPFLKNRYGTRVADGARQFDDARKAYDATERLRVANLAEYEAAHERRKKQVEDDAEARNRDLEDLRSAYTNGEVDAVQAVLELILAKDELPEIDSAYGVAYEKGSRRAIVERQLPTIDVVPQAESVRYVKSANEFAEKRRSAVAVKATYSSVCAAIVVRTICAVAIGDEANAVDTIVVNAYVDTTDPATGRQIRPTLISVSAPAEDIRNLERHILDPIACLKRLRARVSSSAHELVPVTPIVDFNMFDARFVTEANVLGGLDTRPNLAELTPSEFESLMTNLFEKMGLETRQTRASRDGGVDCIAWDMRPVIGGKVVIQAKRYRNTVGVSAVRDLYGAMMNEHASKGILVTTSGYGRAAYEFANEKPMQLLSGENLLALLDEYASVKAKIEFPDDWVDLVNQE